MDVTHCPELSPSSFLHVCIDTNSSFIWATPLRGEDTWYNIAHPLACFAIMGTPNSKQTMALPILLGNLNNFYSHFLFFFFVIFIYFLILIFIFIQSFSIKHITGIPYNPQAQGTVEQAHHTLKLQIKKLKKEIHRNISIFLIQSRFY